MNCTATIIAKDFTTVKEFITQENVTSVIYNYTCVCNYTELTYRSLVFPFRASERKTCIYT